MNLKKNKFEMLLLTFCLTCLTIAWIPQETKEINSELPILKGPYLGQKPPGMKAEIFAPGIISIASSQGYPSFTMDGSEFYFRCSQRGGWVVMKKENDIWHAPRIIPFSTEYKFGEANVSPDGSKILFCSTRAIKGSESSKDLNLWMMKRNGHVWNIPEPLSPILNSKLHEAFPTLSKSGTLYFFREYEDQRGCEILFSKKVNNTFTTPKNVGRSVNSDQHDCDPCVSNNECLLVFCVRDRKDGFGNNDLYISFRTDQGTWSPSVNMGSKVNTKAEEITPHITPDGKYLFFASNREGNYDIYWVDAKILKSYK